MKEAPLLCLLLWMSNLACGQRYARFSQQGKLTLNYRFAIMLTFEIEFASSKHFCRVNEMRNTAR